MRSNDNLLSASLLLTIFQLLSAESPLLSLLLKAVLLRGSLLIFQRIFGQPAKLKGINPHHYRQSSESSAKVDKVKMCSLKVINAFIYQRKDFFS